LIVPQVSWSSGVLMGRCPVLWRLFRAIGSLFF